MLHVPLTPPYHDDWYFTNHKKFHSSQKKNWRSTYTNNAYTYTLRLFFSSSATQDLREFYIQCWRRARVEERSIIYPRASAEQKYPRNPVYILFRFGAARGKLSEKHKFFPFSLSLLFLR